MEGGETSPVFCSFLRIKGDLAVPVARALPGTRAPFLGSAPTPARGAASSTLLPPPLQEPLIY